MVVNGATDTIAAVASVSGDLKGSATISTIASGPAEDGISEEGTVGRHYPPTIKEGSSGCRCALFTRPSSAVAKGAGRCWYACPGLICRKGRAAQTQVQAIKYCSTGRDPPNSTVPSDPGIAAGTSRSTCPTIAANHCISGEGAIDHR